MIKSDGMLLVSLSCIVVSGIGGSAWAGEGGERVERYNVIWGSPSQDSSGSMPLGNGNIGLNVWVEESGDLVFYISSTDAWSENARLLKLARVRIELSPKLVVNGGPFKQTLHLRRGEIEIRAGKAGEEVTLNIWVDANDPVIRVEAEGERAFDLQAELEVWRTKKRALVKREVDSAYGLQGRREPVMVFPDTVVPAKGDRIVWYHRNETLIWPATMKLQGMEAWAKKHTDPLLHRTFGGAIGGRGLVSEGPMKLRSAKPMKRIVVSIYPLTSQTDTVEQWMGQLDASIARIDGKDVAGSRAGHRRWWEAFWDRSWIRALARGTTLPGIVSRAYALQRFLGACAGRGNFPIKFNGSIFTVDARQPDERFDADYRRWGGPYWFQNTRLAYWPMLAAGDYDMMEPLFEMYRAILPMATARTKLYFSHEGAFFPETMYFWGSYANVNYGWERKGKPVWHVDNRYIRWEFEGALELLTIMLDYYDYTQREGFFAGTLGPMADAVLGFYDKHYQRDEDGKLRLDPAQALETYQRAVNPITDVAGLQWVLDGLLALGEKKIGRERAARWRRLRKEIPPLPMKSEGKQRWLVPAEEIIEGPNNSENPELYPVFPFRLYGVGKPDLEVGRQTYVRRRFRGSHGWRQGDIQAALLGLTDEAAKGVSKRFRPQNSAGRFPVFWGPNFDWIPDQDHGGVGVIALQKMLLQADGGKIRVLPAWPKNWDVEFKLHGPQKTTVEGVYRAGKIETLTVTPEKRRVDVILPED